MRRPSVAVNVGGVEIGGENPIVVQSMTNTDTSDVAATVAQAKALAEAGSELVRVTVNDEAAAQAVPEQVPEEPNEVQWTGNAILLELQLCLTPEAQGGQKDLGSGLFRFEPQTGQIMDHQGVISSGCVALRPRLLGSGRQ